jgi:hypothetical protein
MMYLRKNFLPWIIWKTITFFYLWLLKEKFRIVFKASAHVISELRAPAMLVFMWLAIKTYIVVVATNGVQWHYIS